MEFVLFLQQQQQQQQKKKKKKTQNLYTRMWEYSSFILTLLRRVLDLADLEHWYQA